MSASRRLRGQPVPDRVIARAPRTAVELMDVLDLLRAVHGTPERAADPYVRAVFRLTESRLRAAVRREAMP